MFHHTRLTQSIFTGSGAGFILFAASALGGTWVSYDPALNWPVFLTILGSIALFLIVTLLPPHWSMPGLIIAAALVGLYFVSQYDHFYYPLEKGRLAQLGRFSGGLAPNLVFHTPHPNAVAGFLEGVFLLNLVLIWQTRGYKRWWWSLTFIIIAYALFISASRGAWLAVAIAIGIWMLLYVPMRISQIIALGMGLIISVMIGGVVALRLSNLSFLKSLPATAATRLEIYINSLFLFGDYPFTGIGPGDTFAMIYSRYQLLINVPYYYYAHNLYLSIALAQGIGGLMALGLLLFALSRFVLRIEQTRLKTSSQNQTKQIFRVAWLGVTVSLIHGLTDAVQYSGDYWTMPMIFALAGVVVAAGRQIKHQGAKMPGRKDLIISPLRLCSPAPWRLLILSIFAVTTIFFWRPLTAAWYANLGANYQTHAELSEVDQDTRERLLTQAITSFNRALALKPNHAVANRRLGMLALDRNEFETAVTYLEQSYAQEPHNQATLKALGYAYLWAGQLDLAEELLRQVEFQSRLIGELNYWHWWWGAQGQKDLSSYSREMANRLS